jgi:voltage-gated potassium channel
MQNVWLATARRRSLVLIVLYVLLILFGTLGYVVIEHYSVLEGLYMTIITLSTVGFTEVRPLSEYGRMFTMMLILMGASFVAFNLAYFSQILLDGNLLEIYRRRKLKKQLDQLKNHYIVCGYGQMGQIVVQELQRYDVPVVVVENDEPTLGKIAEKGILHLAANATDEESLIAAGITRARGLVAAVSRDSENVFIVLTARDLNKDALILARASTPGTDKRLLKAGADRVVAPFAIGAIRLAHNILRPTVIDFLDLALSAEGMELSMEELCIPEGAHIAGKDLIHSGIRSQYNLIVVGIKRSDGTMIYNPAPQEILQSGDILISIGPQQNLAKFATELLGCPYSALKPCRS